MQIRIKKMRENQQSLCSKQKTKKCMKYENKNCFINNTNSKYDIRDEKGYD